MKIRLKNIGIINDSQIEINGLTVIAGENSTGKSTFGKALYATVNALHDFDQRLQRDKFKLVRDVIASLWVEHRNTEELFFTAREFIDRLKKKELSKESISSIFNEWAEPLGLSVNETDSVVQKISKILLLEDVAIRNNVILGSLRSEFGADIQNIFHLSSEAKVELTISGETTTVTLNDNRVTSVQNVKKLDLQPIYIDDKVLLLLGSREPRFLRFTNDHASDVLDLFYRSKFPSVENTDDERSVSQVIQAMLRTELINPALDKLSEICHGRLNNGKDGFVFQDETDSKIKFSMTNLSAGLKVFLVLQELVINGGLREKATLILDEPEIHLHPEWQVVFAELLVILQKAMGLHILITSHSPYFISALDVFSKKYSVIDQNKYYFAKKVSSSVAKLEDVTQKIRVIYDSMARPYQIIENVASEL